MNDLSIILKPGYKLGRNSRSWKDCANTFSWSGSSSKAQIIKKMLVGLGEIW